MGFSPLPPEGQARPLVGVGEAHGLPVSRRLTAPAMVRSAEPDFALVPRGAIAPSASACPGVAGVALRVPPSPSGHAAAAFGEGLPDWMGAGKEVARGAAAVGRCQATPDRAHLVRQVEQGVRVWRVPKWLGQNQARITKRAFRRQVF